MRFRSCVAVSVGRVVLALVLPLLLGFGGGAAHAQQETQAQRNAGAAPAGAAGNNAPVWREVRSGKAGPTPRSRGARPAC